MHLDFGGVGLQMKITFPYQHALSELSEVFLLLDLFWHSFSLDLK